MRKKNKGILTHFIEAGLRFWINKQCKKLEKINLSLSASNKDILQGKIKKLEITARGINFKELLFEAISIETNSISLDYRVGDQLVKPKEDFSIKVDLSISEAQLNLMLIQSKWKWIGQLLSKEFLNKA